MQNKAFFIFLYLLTRIPIEPFVFLSFVQENKKIFCFLICIHVVNMGVIFYHMTLSAINDTVTIITHKKWKKMIVIIWMRLLRIFWNRTMRLERRVKNLLLWRSDKLRNTESLWAVLTANFLAWVVLFALGLTPFITSPAIVACAAVKYKEGLVPILFGEVVKYVSLFLVV